MAASEKESELNATQRKRNGRRPYTSNLCLIILLCQNRATRIQAHTTQMNWRQISQSGPNTPKAELDDLAVDAAIAIRLPTDPRDTMSLL